MKKILCIILSISFILSMLYGSASANESTQIADVESAETEFTTDSETTSYEDIVTDIEILAGDLNFDGIIDIIDIIIGRAYIVGNADLSDEQLKVGMALNPIDDIFDIVDIISMRAVVVNGNLNRIEPTPKPIDTDTETDTITEEDTATDTETDSEGVRADTDTDGYTFLEVTPERLERAYRALIEYNARGTAVTDEDIRIIKEDCIKYVLNSDNPTFKTWTWDNSITCDNGGYYTGAMAFNTALQGIDKDGNLKYMYNIDTEYYNQAYNLFRNECHRLAFDYIEITLGEYGGGIENHRFNFDVCFQTGSYIVDFVYK